MLEGFNDSDLNLRSTEEIKMQKINLPNKGGIRMT